MREGSHTARQSASAPRTIESIVSAARADRLAFHNAIIGGGTLLTGLLGIAFQAAISHRLNPAEYGAAFAVITLLTLVWLPASALTLVMARQTSRDRATGERLDSAALLKGGNRALLVGGAAATFLMLATSSWLTSFLGVPTQMIVVAALGLPFSLALPLLFGELQGQQRFVELSSLMVAQAGAKLAASLVLGIVIGPTGVILGISAATAFVYIITFWRLREKFSLRSSALWLRPALRFLAIVLPSTVAIAILFSADVLVVKHVFPLRIAGEYAAVAALGRAVFWGAAGVATVLFPKMALRQAEGSSGTPIIVFSFVLVLVGGICASIVLGLLAPTVLTAFAGGAYAPGAVYLPWYALGMTLFGVASVVVAAQQSRGERWFLAVLIPISIIEPALVALFHRTPFEVVMIVDACLAVLLIGLIIPYAISSIRTRNW